MDMITRQLKNKVALCLVLGLTACTQGNDSFSTEPGVGFGWKNMTETQKMVHKAMKEEEGAEAPLSSAFVAESTPILLPESSRVVVAPAAAGSGLDPMTDVMRSPDHYMKIWFAPYQDEVGNLHEECAVHTIVKRGEWVIPKGDV
jgi:hypothetical protein